MTQSLSPSPEIPRWTPPEGFLCVDDIAGKLRKSPNWVRDQIKLGHMNCVGGVKRTGRRTRLPFRTLVPLREFERFCEGGPPCPKPASSC